MGSSFPFLLSICPTTSSSPLHACRISNVRILAAAFSDSVSSVRSAVTNLEFSIEEHSRKWTVFIISSAVAALLLSC
jgi:hypothetical protein